MFPGQVHGSHDGAPRKFVPVLALLLYGLWRAVVQPRGSCVDAHASCLRSRNPFTGIMRGGVHHIGRHEVQPLSQKSCPSQCLPSGPASLRQILGTGHAQNLYSIACSRHLKVAGHSETLHGLAKWKRRAGCIAFQPTPQLLDIQLQCWLCAVPLLGPCPGHIHLSVKLSLSSCPCPQPGHSAGRLADMCSSCAVPNTLSSAATSPAHEHVP